MDFANFIWVVLILIMSAIYADYYSRKNELNKGVVSLIYIVHFAITLFYWNYSIISQSDSLMFFLKAATTINIYEDWGVGTPFVVKLVYILIHYLGCTYFTCFLTFSTFGLLGFLKLFRILTFLDIQNINILGIRVIYIIVLLPQFHMWTCALGKDAITFFASILIIEAIVIERRFTFGLLLGLILFFFIRTYLLMFFIVSFIFSILLFSKLNVLIKLSICSISLVAFLFLKGPILTYFNAESFDVSVISEEIDRVSDYSQNRDGAYIDPNSTNFIILLFTYLFRPLFWDSKTILQLLSSFENLFFLCFFAKFIRFSFFRTLARDRTLQLFFIFFLINLIIKSLTLYNVGLASRQRYIIIPYLIVCIFYHVSQKSEYEERIS